MTRRRRKHPQQLPLPAPTWGGKRAGAGRKPSGDKAGASHRARPSLPSRYPVHVTLRLLPHVDSLRLRKCLQVIRKALEAGHARGGARIVQFSVQTNHIHIIAEAKDRNALSRLIQGFSIRIAKGLNKLMATSGRVFSDRFHMCILKTPLEVRRALLYVLNNVRKHWSGRRQQPPAPDPCSSAYDFDGWKEQLPETQRGSPLSVVARARSWLLTSGWRRHGAISLHTSPA